MFKSCIVSFFSSDGSRVQDKPDETKELCDGDVWQGHYGWSKGNGSMKKFSVEFFNTVCMVLQHYSNTRCFQTLFLLLYIQCVKSETMNNFSVSVHKIEIC